MICFSTECSDDFPSEPANVFVADIVEAGFLPRAFFDSLFGGPAGGAGIIGFTPSFVFTDDDGNPLDLNGDNYFDVALSEMYLNDTFGDPNAPDSSGFPWGINVDLPGIDVQSIALHENGHAFQIGHFGPPPRAVMGPVYGGLLQRPVADRPGKPEHPVVALAASLRPLETTQLCSATGRALVHVP